MSGKNVDATAFQQSLEKRLDELGSKVIDEVIATGFEIRNEAVKRTPVNTGALRSGWQVDSGRTANGGWVEVRNDVPYAAAVEYGTKPHTIRAKNKKVLANQKEGAVFGTEVNHPGTKARPMLRPALVAGLNSLARRLKGV
jgi:hypothetical protein